MEQRLSLQTPPRDAALVKPTEASTTDRPQSTDDASDYDEPDDDEPDGDDRSQNPVLKILSVAGEELASLPISTDSTVASCKRQIASLLGVPVESQNLLAGSRILEDQD